MDNNTWLEKEENTDINSAVIQVDFERDVTLEHREHSHHHHHHHHHHHNKSKKKSQRPKGLKNKGRENKKESKFKKFLKRKKHTILNVVFAIIIIFLVLVIAFGMDSLSNFDGKGHGEDIIISNDSVEVESSIYTKPITVVSPAVVEFITTDKTARSVREDYMGYEYRLDVSLPVEYACEIKGLPDGVEVRESILEVSENKNFVDSFKYNLENGYGTINLYNLKTGTQYYYKLNVILSEGSQLYYGGTFTTENTPRIMTIDGIRNVRDIGGWKAEGGKTIKQGLLFRGTEMDGAFEEAYTITQDGIRQMRETLNIKYDLDLRGKTVDTKNMLGSDVEHNYYNVSMYSGIHAEGNKEPIRNVFSALADKNNYPMYLHCTYGRDRTGTVCYLLEGLLGVSDYDLRKDYELTLLYDGSEKIDEFIGFTTLIQTMEGANTQEKIEGYLLSIGVTEQEIANIKEIFLG